jgi:hypothetical protein
MAKAEFDKVMEAARAELTRITALTHLDPDQVCEALRNFSEFSIDYS